MSVMGDRCEVCDARADLGNAEHVEHVDQLLQETAHLIVCKVLYAPREDVLGLAGRYFTLMSHVHGLYGRG